MALTLALTASPLAAQSANDWRLPGATVRPAPPGSQGPVDRDNPVVTTSVPRPAQTATPASTPAPSPSPSAVTPVPAASSAPTARPTRQPAMQPAARQAAPAASPSTAVSASGAVPPATTVPETLPGAAALPSQSAPAPIVPAPAAQPAATNWYWPWIAGAAALLALVFAGLWWRRRTETSLTQVEFERPIVPAATPVSEPEPAPEPVAVAPVPPHVLPEPHLSLELPTSLGITLEARRMSASLMATTLNYVLRLTNTGTEPLLALAVEGDMVSAHASLPPEAQIANDNQRLEMRHNLVALAPGESAEFTGDFRLPLAAVTPIRAGDAALFVPLARLRIAASTASGAPLVQARTWVVGELPEDPGAALKPFRLDLGPRTYSRIGQRAVN